LTGPDISDFFSFLNLNFSELKFVTDCCCCCFGSLRKRFFKSSIDELEPKSLRLIMAPIELLFGMLATLTVEIEYFLSRFVRIVANLPSFSSTNFVLNISVSSLNVSSFRDWLSVAVLTSSF
jgi:hypothetical protein